jgi:FkbH-like protein
MTLPRNSRTELRAEIDGQMAGGNWAQALAALGGLWRADRTSSTAFYVISCFERLRPHVNLTPCRVAILRSYTLEPAIPVLRAEALMGGLDIAVQMADFDNYSQQILDPASALDEFKPDVVIFAVQTRDIAPDIWDNHTSASAEHQASRVEEIAGNIREWAQVFRSRSSASMILHTFERPSHPRAGVLDAQSANGQVALIQRLNQRMQEMASEILGVYLLDYDALVSRAGRAAWHDEKKWLTMRMPIRAENLPALAQEWLRFVHPLMGRIGKVLVTDLDNTLWGGVIGEDGIEGIQLGREYPGAGYDALQRAILDLYNRGILLAISSKNNEADAMTALNHPDMVLRADHFASLRLNWNPKAENLCEIAEELNVGLDSLVFLDDNPVERDSVRAALPQVTVIELPADSLSYANALRECPMFERLTTSAEDRQRTTYYVQERQRRDIEKSVPSLTDFYYSLNQTIEIVPLSSATLGRISQLTKKTNQFNLTTKRYNEAEMTEFAGKPGSSVYAAKVGDRFGDNGLVGVCLTRLQGDACEIDTFLLSCRVIGRTVETAILSFLVKDALTKGATRLQGWFLPTAKNKPSESFYQTHGFQLLEQTEAGSLWSLDLREANVECPPWIMLNAPEEMQEACDQARAVAS